ncbi:Ig-like domain-containing protein, partial [Colwellia sp. RSH04]|uniref:Ig-like domain-containing protein n=1 Tax=Colwellia sp. RSH04 TaxID=2305464 RepID=UPI000E567CA2
YTYFDADSDVESGTTFKWYASDDAGGTNKTQIATTENFTLTAGQVGKYISFEVTPVNANASGSAVESAINGTAVIAADTAPTASSVSFSGTLQVGELLTSSYTYFDADSDVESGTTFKWYASDDAGGTNKTQIATTENFTLTAGQVGKYISFEVTPVNANASGSAVESAINGTAVIAADTAPTASSVSFSGTLQVGELLTSSYSYFDADSDVESGTTFKWYASDDAGGTNKTQIATTENFTLTAGQVGKYISFEVTPVNANASGSAVESAINGTAVIAADTAPTASSVSFSGTLQVGELLTSSYTYFDADSDVESGTTFKWYASDDAGGTNKTQIATTENFTLTAGQVGKYISFEVTPVNANASGSAVESAINGTAVIAADTAPTASSVSFSGTLQVGELLTSSYSYFDADNDVESGTTFKWYASDDAGGTNKTQIATTENFTLTAGQVGKYISFEVTPVNANASGSAVESAINSTSVAVVNTAPTATNVIITSSNADKLVVGNVLTGSYNYQDADQDSEGQSTFRWLINDIAIDSAINSSYTIRAEDTGKTITFEVTPVAQTGEVKGNPVLSNGVKVSSNAPVADAQSVTVEEDTSLQIMLTASDLDKDELSYSLVTQPSHGELTGNAPELTYVPENNFNGTDSFTFKVSDGEFDSETVTVTIEVTPVNDSPVATDDYIELSSWEVANIDVLENDIDIDQGDIKIIGSTVDIGSVAVNESNIAYTPIVGFIGQAKITYHISDEQGRQSSASVFININVDDSNLPIITPPTDLEIDAQGLFTKVDLDIPMAVDKNGEKIPVSIDGNTLFKPGINKIFWRAEDSEGNTAIVSQIIKVKPLISIEKDQTALEGYSASARVHLNGLSPSYPLSIPYTVSGTAEEGSDHDLINGEITIESGTGSVIDFNIFTDQVNDENETIIITLDSSLNLGHKKAQVISISENNIKPKLTLNVEQADEKRLIVNAEDGFVVVSPTIKHPIVDNDYSYEWSSKQDVLTDLDSDMNTFSFEPSELTSGVYHIRLDITDIDAPELSAHKEVTIKVEQNKAILTDDDSDKDGIPDNIEGLSDLDNDGIPDYLDNIAECNVIPELVEETNSFLIEGDPGVCLRLGDRALGGDSGGVLISDVETSMANNTDDTNISTNHNVVNNTDSEATNVGGIFDFIAYDLPEEGQAYRIVLPQVKPIPAHAIYRKQQANGEWVNFEENSTNLLWSSEGEFGYCPAPGDEKWQPGLTEGHWCVQLQITDGGPNDADSIANNTIVDPGGVAVSNNNNQQPIAVADNARVKVNASLTIDVLANDSDSDGDTLELNSVNAMFGTVTIENNQIHYQAQLNFYGEDKVIYGVSDSQGGSASAILTVTVLENQAPVAIADSATVVAGESVIIDVLSNDTDLESDQLTVISAIATQGTVSINSDNTLTYTANADFSGIDSLEYTIQDVFGGESSVAFDVTVTAAPEPEPKQDRSSGGGTSWISLLSVMIFSLRKKFKRAIKAGKK